MGIGGTIGLVGEGDITTKPEPAVPATASASPAPGAAFIRSNQPKVHEQQVGKEGHVRDTTTAPPSGYSPADP